MAGTELQIPVQGRGQWGRGLREDGAAAAGLQGAEHGPQLVVRGLGGGA